MRLVAAFATALMLLCLGALPSHAEKRVALVVGNGAYQHADKLSNPVTDARRLKEALDKLGFEIVYGENLDQQSLRRTIGRFANAAQDADVALVFYAGHGATFGDVPYVVPVDAQFSSLGEMPTNWYRSRPLSASCAGRRDCASPSWTPAVTIRPSGN
jgi:uncharacterized caspase-like protein